MIWKQYVWAEQSGECLTDGICDVRNVHDTEFIKTTGKHEGIVYSSQGQRLE